MKSIRLVIPDLFLPQQVASEVCGGLTLPGLETLLARAQPEPLPVTSLEAWLCRAFGVSDQSIAPITLLTEGLEPGIFYWLRADPVHLRLQRDQLILQTEIPLTAEEAAQLCTSLNEHFAADGLRFFAPHPQRWYLQLDAAPEINTTPLAQVTGRDVHAYLPQGADALRWHRIFNEIQMLLFEHAVNQAREGRGELAINSLWLWGGGFAVGNLLRPCARMVSDSDLALSFAQMAGVPSDSFPGEATQYVADDEGEQLIVWDGLRRSLQLGDLHAWREGLKYFDQYCAKPLLDALLDGRIAQLLLDVPQHVASAGFVLTRNAAWKLWKRPKPLARYAV